MYYLGINAGTLEHELSTLYSHKPISMRLEFRKMIFILSMQEPSRIAQLIMLSSGVKADNELGTEAPQNHSEETRAEYILILVEISNDRLPLEHASMCHHYLQVHEDRNL